MSLLCISDIALASEVLLSLLSAAWPCCCWCHWLVALRGIVLVLRWGGSEGVGKMGRERATAVWSGGGGKQDRQTNAHREARHVLALMGIPAVIKCCLLSTWGMAEALLSSLLPDQCIPGCLWLIRFHWQQVVFSPVLPIQGSWGF